MKNNLAVIMSIYKNDRLKFLKQSIDSILNQTYTKFDFYIQIDGEINQNCYKYLKSLVDNRIKLNFRNENKGLAISLNELITKFELLKKYEYIVRMDADDISKKIRFESQLQFLQLNKKIDCLGTWAIEINEENAFFFKKKMPITHESCYELFKKRDCMIHPTVMFRNTFFIKAGLYPEQTYYAEDTLMWANGFKNGCIFANIPEFLLYFRLDENFFNRRTGWNHAISIFNLRLKVNRLLGFSFKADLYAFTYFFIKLLPSFLLKIIYKKLR